MVAVSGKLEDPGGNLRFAELAADMAEDFPESFLPQFSALKVRVDILVVNDFSVRIHCHGRPAAEIQKRFHPVFQKKFQHLIEHAEIIASGRTPVCQHQLPGEDIPDTRVLKVQVVAQIKAVFLNIRLGQVMHFANIDHLVPDLAQQSRRILVYVCCNQSVDFSIIRQVPACIKFFPDLLFLKCGSAHSIVLLILSSFPVLSRCLARHLLERTAESG